MYSSVRLYEVLIAVHARVYMKKVILSAGGCGPHV